jgi:hypothetical protein
VANLRKFEVRGCEQFWTASDMKNFFTNFQLVRIFHNFLGLSLIGATEYCQCQPSLIFLQRRYYSVFSTYTYRRLMTTLTSSFTLFHVCSSSSSRSMTRWTHQTRAAKPPSTQLARGACRRNAADASASRGPNP